MKNRNLRHPLRRLMCCLLTGAALLGLNGCAGIPPEEKDIPSLPPVQSRYTAPDGDIPVGEERMYTLYLPGKNGMHLTAQHVTLGPDALQETLESLVWDLLSYESNDLVDSLGKGRVLSLFGPDPVELSGGVCTVNLGSSALQLNYQDFYTLSLALASTLCELEAVDSVNVLVAGQSVGLDITGVLPMGSLTAHPGENLPVLWERMEARRTPMGQNMSRTAMSSYVTVYFPLENGQGITCENRMLSFEGQTPQQMTNTILETMSAGSMYLTGVPDMPNLSSLMLHEPLASELADGGRLITLSFQEDVMDRLSEAGIDPTCLMAAITFSLTTFIPGTAAVSLRAGEQPITQLESERFGTIAVLGGLMRRENFKQLLMGRTTVYFARNGVLVPCVKYVDRKQADSPREQLAALMEGPGARRWTDGLEPTLPEAVRPDDILGLNAVGDTLLVNLSESFRSEIQASGPEKERLLCYSMVNTLCENSTLNHVCFFFEGEQVDNIAGEICWSGVFDRNSGLTEPSYG